MNYYTIEQIARDMQSDRMREATSQRRWSNARRAIQRIAQSRSTK